MSFCPVNQLEKYGWEKGSGLGKEQQGMKEAIKVKLKFDSTGVGHDPGEQFTHNWWEKAFNTAASNIQVTENENGVGIQKTGDMHISTKKFNKSSMKKSMLYGTFVKAGTLTDGMELHDKESDNSSSDSSDDENTKTSNTNSKTPLTDEELFKICGGRTAHKGARHGLKLNGKLARIAEQEAKLHSSVEKSSPVKVTAEKISQKDPEKKQKRKKKSKKERKSKDNEEKINDITDFCHSEISVLDNGSGNDGEKLKKSRKRKKQEGHDSVVTEICDLNREVKFEKSENCESITVLPRKKKKKDKKKKIKGQE